MRIVALHGFLGRGSDFEFLRAAGFEVVAPDLFAPVLANGLGSIERGGVILGYSMGGRLALQIANDYDLAVIISAGITPGDEARREADEAWAKRFESDDWTTLMRDWNAQPVFGGHVQPRDESDFDRRALAAALREWSPAVLMPPDLTKIATPVLWIAGERDTKYVEEGRKAVARLARGRLVVVEGAGHRVPFERPDAVIDLLHDALARR